MSTNTKNWRWATHTSLNKFKKKTRINSGFLENKQSYSTCDTCNVIHGNGQSPVMEIKDRKKFDGVISS